jgi:transcriptional regulator
MGHESEFLYGTLELLLLRAFDAGDAMHGYGVAEWVVARTGGEIEVDEAALYRALHRLEHRGLLGSEWGVSENNRRAKYYRLTARGRARLSEGSASWRRFAAAVEQVLGAGA